MWECDRFIDATPPVFSTLLKLPSDELTPTGTRPDPQDTQVPPQNVLGFVLFVDKYIDPTG